MARGNYEDQVLRPSKLTLITRRLLTYQRQWKCTLYEAWMGQARSWRYNAVKWLRPLGINRHPDNPDADKDGMLYLPPGTSHVLPVAKQEYLAGITRTCPICSVEKAYWPNFFVNDPASYTVGIGAYHYDVRYASDANGRPIGEICRDCM